MFWFARPYDAPPGLPDKSYALFRTMEGWFYVRGKQGPVRGERYREGPFPEREDARYWAWKDAEERGLVESFS